jgi:DNA repair protein RadC
MAKRAKVRKANDILIPFRGSFEDELVQYLRDVGGVSKKVALQILEYYPAGDGLETATVKSLMDAGATEKQAQRISAAFGLVRVCDASCRMRAVDSVVGSPQAAAAVVRHAVGDAQQEHFVAVLLDARQAVLDVLGISVGSLAQVDVHPREVFRDAIRRGAHSMIIAHNHPSGQAKPSSADVDLTRRMVQAGELMGVPVLDHLVVTTDDAFSFAANGLL